MAATTFFLPRSHPGRPFGFKRRNQLRGGCYECAFRLVSTNAVDAMHLARDLNQSIRWHYAAGLIQDEPGTQFALGSHWGRDGFLNSPAMSEPIERGTAS